jgi:hypothetical protein
MRNPRQIDAELKPTRHGHQQAGTRKQYVRDRSLD